MQGYMSNDYAARSGTRQATLVLFSLFFFFFGLLEQESVPFPTNHHDEHGRRHGSLPVSAHIEKFVCSHKMEMVHG